MIMFNIAEWIANVLILGLGVFFWVISIALLFFVLNEAVSKVMEYRYDS